jgi:hypothetical protein
MNAIRFKILAAGTLVSLAASGLALAGQGHRGHHGGMLGAHLFERVDTNKDARVTRAEAQGEVEKLFTRLDANKDGAVTQEEGQTGARAIAQEEIEARFKAQDANQDGRVTLEESKLPRRFFEKLDQNGDKALTRNEVDAGRHAESGHRMFTKADADRDGKVTRAEATQAALARFDRMDDNSDGVIARAELDAKRGKQGKAHGKHGDGKRADGQKQGTK